MRRAAKRRPGTKQAPKRTARGGARQAASKPRAARATDVGVSPDAYEALRDFAAAAGVEIRAVTEALADQLDDDPLLADRVRIAVSAPDQDGDAWRDRSSRIPEPAANSTWTRLPVIGIPIFTPALLPLKWSVAFLRAWLPSAPPD
jgi:hypothetical protein